LTTKRMYTRHIALAQLSFDASPGVFHYTQGRSFGPNECDF
jgi:hypothetical protein